MSQCQSVETYFQAFVVYLFKNDFFGAFAYSQLHGGCRCRKRRTKVIDDNSDYYSSDNKWLTLEQREMIRKKEEELYAEQHASRRQQKVCDENNDYTTQAGLLLYLCYLALFKML